MVGELRGADAPGTTRETDSEVVLSGWFAEEEEAQEDEPVTGTRASSV
jgi:hypothetical protein